MAHISEQIEPVEILPAPRPEGGIPDGLAVAVVTGVGEFMLFLGFVAAALVLGGDVGWRFPAAVLILSTVRTGFMHAGRLLIRFRSPEGQEGAGEQGIRAILYGRWVMTLVMLLLLVVIGQGGALQ